MPLPFNFPTKPCFGGPELKTLYVTSGKNSAPALAPAAIPGGAVFALEPGETGVPEAPFAD